MLVWENTVEIQIEYPFLYKQSRSFTSMLVSWSVL